MRPQIHVAQIQNGWLVITPIAINKLNIQQAQAIKSGEFQMPTEQHYCSDVDEVCEYLKQWESSQSISR